MLHALKACAELTVASLVHDDEEASHAASLRTVASDVIIAPVPRHTNLLRGGVKLLTTTRPLTLELLNAPALQPLLEKTVERSRPDVVFAYCSGMARFAMEPPLSGIPFVLDMVDVDSAKWSALSRSSAWPKRRIYAREAVCLADFERIAIRAAAVTLAVNAREAVAVRELVPDARVSVVENGIDLAGFSPPEGPAAGAQVTFCGVLDYEPNETAALRLGRQVWPLVRRKRPDASLLLVGSKPTQAVRALSDSDSTIRVTGAVPDVRPFLWESALSAVPLVTARGLQNKVLEALAAGLPVVTTPVVAEGLPESALRGCIVARDDDALAHGILQLLDAGPAARRQLAGQAGLEELTWAKQLAPLCGIVERAARSR